MDDKAQTLNKANMESLARIVEAYHNTGLEEDHDYSKPLEKTLDNSNESGPKMNENKVYANNLLVKNAIFSPDMRLAKWVMSGAAGIKGKISDFLQILGWKFFRNKKVV